MYTGIVQGISKVVRLKRVGGVLNITLAFSDELLHNLVLGASVSIDGVCMTVSGMDGKNISFDAMKETLENTTLGKFEVGDFVNIERSAKQGSEIGGHILSGHVEGMAEIINIDAVDNNFVATFRFPKAWNEYIFHKGFIGINGASLTVVKYDNKKNEFCVYFIPETLRLTTFAEKKAGDFVNIEIDSQTKIIVDTVKNYMNHQKNN
jgi:riboflavin synthase